MTKTWTKTKFVFIYRDTRLVESCEHFPEEPIIPAGVVPTALTGDGSRVWWQRVYFSQSILKLCKYMIALFICVGKKWGIL